MHQAETLVFLLALMTALVVISRKLQIPYPVMLVLGGLAISFIPHLPALKLDPNFVFYFCLPPLIFPAALFTSWRDFRRHLRPILLLAVAFRLLDAVKLFDVIYIMTGGGPGTTTYTAAFYLYEKGFQEFHISQATAGSWMFLILTIPVVSVLVRRLLRPETA